VGVESCGIANLGIKVASMGIKGSSTSKFVVHKKNFCDDSMIQNMKYLNWNAGPTLNWDTCMFVISVPSNEISLWANTCFGAHAIAPPCRNTNNEAFQVVKGLCDIYTLLNLECYKCAIIRFHWANDLVVLRICAHSLLHSCNTDLCVK